MKNVRKAFPGILALDDASFDLRDGEIHAIVGKNGAGKSTLISIISATLRPDAGEILLDGNEVSSDGLNQLKVATVFQESTIFPNLTIGENILLDDTAIRDGVGSRERADTYLKQFDFDVSPDDPITSLSPAERKVVEIMRALARNCRILILDEPTAALNIKETDRLFELLRAARRNGVAIIYISHRLQEIFDIADRVTVMRDGRVELVSAPSELDMGQLVNTITGGVETSAKSQPRRVLNKRAEDAPVRVEIDDLSHSGGRFSGVSISLKEGEILGLGGLVGAGKTELGKALFGAEPLASGVVRLDGEQVDHSSPSSAIACGIVYVPEDRKNEGLFADMSIVANLNVSLFDRFTNRFRFVQHRAMADAARRMATSIGVKATNVDQVVSTLSGGNQQKVLLGRWLQVAPKLLIVDEPTVGVDVSARQQIYELIRERAHAGASVIFISSELNELMENADHIITMYKGGITGKYDAGFVSEDELMVSISGATA